MSWINIAPTVMSATENVENNESSTGKLLGGITGKGFMPGQCGNPGGRPKKKPLTELYEQLLEDPEFVEMVKEAVTKAVSKGSMAMVLHLKEMAERVEGKVTQPIEADVTLSSLAERMQRAKERANVTE